eukprot:EG_transcript_48144
MGTAALEVFTISSLPSAFWTSQVQPEPKFALTGLLGRDDGKWKNCHTIYSSLKKGLENITSKKPHLKRLLKSEFKSPGVPPSLPRTSPISLWNRRHLLHICESVKRTGFNM